MEPYLVFGVVSHREKERRGRQQTLLSALSGVTQVGNSSAPSMSKKDPSSSSTVTARSGNEVESWTKRETRNHSSSIESVTSREPL